MATTTLKSHTLRAIEFSKKTDLYMVLAKPSAWPDEEVPTPETPESELDTPLTYKKVQQIYLVVPDEEGTIEYGDTFWSVVAEVDALDELARWVFLRSSFEYEAHPLVSFRQVGVVSGLIPLESVPPGQLELIPDEVDDPGVLEIIDNRAVMTRKEDQREVISFIVEF